MNSDFQKVVHLSSVHNASDTRIFLKECLSLAAAGYRVTLVARAERDAVIGDVKIRAVKGGTGNRLRRMTATVMEVYRKAVDADGDIYHFHDPELIPVGLALKLRGKRVIYDIHENVVKQVHSKQWIPAALRHIVATMYRVIERVTISVIDGVVAATPGIAISLPSSKTVVVHNFAISEELVSIDVTNYACRRPSVVYIGGITRARGIQEMVDAMGLIDMDATLLLAGFFDPSSLEVDMQNRQGYSRVDYRGWLDREGIRKLLESAQVGLLTLHPEPNYVDSFPVKLFEYMAAGIPVVCSNFPFWEQFVRDTGCGLMVDPFDASEIANAIQWLLDHPEKAQEMGKRGREAVLKQYNWEAESRKLLDLYDRIQGYCTSKT